MFKLLHAALLFVAGVVKLIARWAMLFYRYERRVYRGVSRLLGRLVTVEQRVRPHYRKAVFLYRFAHYALYRLRMLPRWAKLLKLVIIAGIILQPYLWDYFERRQEAQRLYTEYYSQFYAEYAKTLPRDQAKYYASYYANYYAEYFTSDAYLEALRYALPEATPEIVEVPKEEVPKEENVPLYVTAEGMQLIREFEKLVLKPYLDAGGKLTVGYGHLVRKGERYGTIGHEQAEAMLLEDMRVAESYVKRLVKVPLTPHQYSALVSLVFNIGPTQFRRSTLLKKLNQGDYETAAEEFLRWQYVGDRKVRGLLRRRIAERALFLEGMQQV